MEGYSWRLWGSHPFRRLPQSLERVANTGTGSTPTVHALTGAHQWPDHLAPTPSRRSLRVQRPRPLHHGEGRADDRIRDGAAPPHGQFRSPSPGDGHGPDGKKKHWVQGLADRWFGGSGSGCRGPGGRPDTDRVKAEPYPCELKPGRGAEKGRSA